MERFFSILIATFISVLAALATWHFTQDHFARKAAAQFALEAAKEAADKSLAKEAEGNLVAETADTVEYVWESREHTNPVTGEKISMTSRSMGETGGAITFRCYGLRKKEFDLLITFPNAVEWSTYRGAYASMSFRLDDGKLFEFLVDRHSSSVAIPDINKLKDRAEVRELRKIGDASLFQASISDGTIFQQTISIDLSGIKDAVAPVLALCGKTAI